MVKAKLVSSTLLEVVVAITLVLTILVMTFTVFINIYRSSLTLPQIQTFLLKNETLNQTISSKKFISFSKEIPTGMIFQEVEDTANGMLKIRIQSDSSSKNNDVMKIWILKDE